MVDVNKPFSFLHKTHTGRDDPRDIKLYSLKGRLHTLGCAWSKPNKTARLKYMRAKGLPTKSISRWFAMHPKFVPGFDHTTMTGQDGLHLEEDGLFQCGRTPHPSMTLPRTARMFVVTLWAITLLVWPMRTHARARAPCLAPSPGPRHHPPHLPPSLLQITATRSGTWPWCTSSGSRFRKR